MLTIHKGEDKLTALISGELDHHKCTIIRKKIDMCIEQEKPQLLELDFSGVQFMDSSGIGLVMGRYRQMTMTGGRLAVINIPAHLVGIFKLSGLSALGVIR